MARETIDSLVERVARGERAGVARALRWVDDAPVLGRRLTSALHDHVGNAQVIGVTGNPGAGKSTVVDVMISELRAAGKSVAVLAVDPSSPFSGGAILGDRIRMSRHALDDGVYIRSLATRGTLGGLSRASFDSVRILDAAGYDVVLLETVGVGQDEVDVARLAHTTVVVLVPGMGDDVQAIKAGILEIADVFLINKADRPGADDLERSLKQVLMLGPGATSWEPPILRSVANRGEGIDTLLSAISEHREFLLGPEGDVRRRLQAREVFERLLDAALVDQGRQQLGQQLEEARGRVEGQGVDPYAEVVRLLGLEEA